MEGLTITGKPLKDTIEAKNLSHALDLFEQLADRRTDPITERDIREIHSAILKGIDDVNAGMYRTSDVEISGSKYKPPSHIEVAPKMAEFSAWLQEITNPTTVDSQFNPIVVAAAAHAWFVTTHPFVDGNGRTARIILNIILMRFGYPIAIITREDRERYYDALEESQVSDLTPFIGLVRECVEESLEEYQIAAKEQTEQQEWTRSIVASLEEKEKKKVQFEYEIWKAAMDLLRNFFSQTVNKINDADALGLINVYIRDFGHLDFEKFVSLRRGDSAKRTWFFRIDFRTGEKAARFIFFFGSFSRAMKAKARSPGVSLFVSYEAEPFRFQRIEESPRPDLPDLVEVAYQPESEQFLCRYRDARVMGQRVEVFGKNFIEQISSRQF
jgi:Fic family protein